MPVTIKSAIIHILDTSAGLPVLSDRLMLIEKEIEDYISGIIDKSFHSDDVKECMFKAESTLWEQCQNASWNLIPISQSIAENMFSIMRRNAEIPVADVVMGISQMDGNDYLFMLKFDYRSAFTHFAGVKNDNKEINIIRYRTLLPAQAAKVPEGFFINMQTPSVKVIERQFTVDGIKDFYLSTQILACTENKTPRQKATKILKVAEKVAELYYAKEDEMNTHISSTMFDELQQEQPLVVENLGQKFFAKNPAAREEFFERLAAVDIGKDEILALSEKFQKKFGKQAIKTSSGVEIKIPTQVYSNVDEIEFINNPDGTVSLLIKNIKI
ncbi:nucleoid-associated protein [Acetonema longum]|uniref:Nucleoid-associated protein n=1 Tax=Acetonema longum DSM 6540 TaxID=1009370 RepID=F7NM49_9FIRM|nr:nucleoid-associated protein [Acetonema longum]EGO62885.1 hypothetical protein ALO_15877 [Acetonema longum DSM 6540]